MQKFLVDVLHWRTSGSFLFWHTYIFYPHTWEIEAETVDEAERMAKDRIKQENEHLEERFHCKDCKNDRSDRHYKHLPKHYWDYLQRICIEKEPYHKHVVRQYKGPWPKYLDKD